MSQYGKIMVDAAPINYNMGQGVVGSTSGYKLKYDDTKWDHLYQERPKDMPMVVYQGTPLPLANEVRPSIMPKEPMFYLQNAISKTECCTLGDNTYSTSTGCVCLPSWARYNIGYTRSGNNTTPTYPYI